MMARIVAVVLLCVGLFCVAEAQQPNFPITLLDLPSLGTQQSGSLVGYTALTPSASANTKGSYTQLFASTTNVTNTIVVQAFVSPQSASSRSFLIDIATGGAGSEVVLIPNIAVSVGAQGGVAAITEVVPVPIIPAGTRIAARTQVNNSSSTDTSNIQLNLFTGGFGAVGIDNISALTATSIGTAVTPGNGSRGSYAQLTASSAHAYKGFFYTVDTQGVASGDYTQCELDLATGGAGSEVIFYSSANFYYISDGIAPSFSPYLPFSIATGVRFAARAQCGGTQLAFGLSLYGVR